MTDLILPVRESSEKIPPVTEPEKAFIVHYIIRVFLLKCIIAVINGDGLDLFDVFSYQRKASVLKYLAISHCSKVPEGIVTIHIADGEAFAVLRRWFDEESGADHQHNPVIVNVIPHQLVSKGPSVNGYGTGRKGFGKEELMSCDILIFFYPDPAVLELLP